MNQPITSTTTTTAVTVLADRWEQMAANEETSIPFLEGPAAPYVAETIRERCRIYRRAAADLREVLRTGRLPHGLMTDAELEQYGSQPKPAAPTA